MNAAIFVFVRLMSVSANYDLICMSFDSYYAPLTLSKSPPVWSHEASAMLTTRQGLDRCKLQSHR